MPGSTSRSGYIERLSAAARRAAAERDWSRVGRCARDILRRSRDDAEGHFLIGLCEKARNRPGRAVDAFSAALNSDAGRYDAAVELAEQYMRSHRYGQAAELLRQHEREMGNSPRYLHMAGTIYMNIGLPGRAWPLLRRADELQPDVDSLRAGLAACSTFVGRIDDARDIYRALLRKSPRHQRNHYELSRVETATDASHVEQMKSVLRQANLPPARNVYLYYAIGKELEDLGQWDEAFRYYVMAGDAAASVADYDVGSDIDLIDAIIDTCDAGWLEGAAVNDDPGAVPVFIVGLPRTGTTLTERILSSHSEIESAGENYALQIVLQRVAGVANGAGMDAAVIDAASGCDARRIADGYREAVAYKLDGSAVFLEKFPENFLYLGFIAKAFPSARIIHLDRHPMDTCFAMYKQSFFRYAYTLDDLGRYYVAYRRLHEHWKDVLGDRLTGIRYEDLVADQEGQTRRLLNAVGVGFEAACLRFEKNETASNTASAAQVREKIHSRSVGRWRRFASHLEPLRTHLHGAGIDVG